MIEIYIANNFSMDVLLRNLGKPEYGGPNLKTNNKL